MTTEPDVRSVRELLLDIDRKVEVLAAPRTVAERAPKNYPVRLPQAAEDALEIIFAEAAEMRRRSINRTPRTLAQLAKELNDLSPGCVTGPSGEFSDSVRAHAAEFLGLNVSWRLVK